VRVPDVFDWVTPAPRAAFMRPEAVEWSLALMTERQTLWDAARRRGPEFILQGRAPLMVVSAGDGANAGTQLWVIRRYWRGGGMAFLDDRHLRVGISRPLLEAESSEILRERGIDTPRVIGGAVYDSGVFYRADLVTEYVPDAVELRTLLLAPEEPWRSDSELRLGAVAKSGALVARLARAGARHPDLNASNILTTRDGEETTSIVIDLDRCRVFDAAVPVEPMLNRLRRSVAKSARAMGSSFPAEAWGILERAAMDGTVQGGTAA
jgi:3-deoxy-D-manno-octulosonic acid kinase